MCIMPVGEGAIRVTTGRSDMEVEGSGEAAAHGVAWAGPLSTRIRRLPSLAEAWSWLVAQVGRQADRWTLWTPVALGSGAGLYFAVPREPQAWVGWLAVAVAAVRLIVAAGWRPARAVTAALVLTAAAIGGFSAAKLRTDHVRSPTAPLKGPPARLDGWVVDIASPGQGGRRLLIAPARIGDWPAAATPTRVRVTLKNGYTPSPGEPISLLAILNAPPQPARPGSYDFARDAYFQSVGGVGFALGTPQSWTPDAAPPWRLRLTMRMNATRWALT